MKKAIIWIVIALALVALLVGAYFAYAWLSGQFTPETSGQSGEDDNAMIAPDFTVYDGQGNPVALSQLKDKPVVINAWATWCVYCKEEMPYFETLSQKYGDQVYFMMINLTTQDSLEDAKVFLQDAGYTFPVYYDTDGQVAATYPVSSIPATFFVDENGTYVGGWKGAIPEETLENTILDLLK